MRLWSVLALWFGLAAGAAVVPAGAEERLGPVTQQPMPRWVSLKADEANARRGPSIDHRIDWVFRHRNMPLLVTAEYEHWRRVEDRDGAAGWMHYVLLSRARTVIVDEDLLPLRRKPDPNADVVAEAKKGVVAFLKDDCAAGWCRISADGYTGWVPQDKVWGAGDPVEAENAIQETTHGEPPLN